MVDPGRRVYVRRINLAGNTRTRDEVIRREMRQMESSWYGADKITRSKQRLERLQYFSEVNLETPAVPGTSDQVDVNLSVTEKSTGSIMFGAGLSSAEGIVLGVTVNQNNFLGTGNRVSAQINTGKVNTVYSLSYTDPYYTPDGISRTFNVYRRDVDTTSLGTGTYKTSSYGAGVSFGVPLNERDSVSAGITFDYTDVSLDASSPVQYKQYCGSTQALGCSNYSWVLNLGWAHDTRDNTLFPNPYDMTPLVWRKDSHAFTFEYNQRGHQVYRVIEVDATTGKTVFATNDNWGAPDTASALSYWFFNRKTCPRPDRASAFRMSSARAASKSDIARSYCRSSMNTMPRVFSGAGLAGSSLMASP